MLSEESFFLTVPEKRPIGSTKPDHVKVENIDAEERTFNLQEQEVPGARLQSKVLYSKLTAQEFKYRREGLTKRINIIKKS